MLAIPFHEEWETSDGEHVPRRTPAKPAWTNLAGRSSGQVPLTASAGLTAASERFQKCINGAHFTLELY